MEVRFVAGVTPIVESAEKAREFYGRELGLPVRAEGEVYSLVVRQQVLGVTHSSSAFSSLQEATQIG